MCRSVFWVKSRSLLLCHCPPVLIFQELFSINWLFVLCQTMQIYYTPAVFCCCWGKKCLQPPLFCSTSPIEGLYDVLIKKLTGAMHNLLSSLTRWPRGGQLRMGQCLLSQIVTKRERGVARGLAGGDLDGKAQMCRWGTACLWPKLCWGVHSYFRELRKALFFLSWEGGQK